MILRKYFSELLEDGSQNVQMHTLINPWRTKSQLAAYAYIAEQYGYRYMGLAPYSSSGRSFPIFGFRRLPDAEERARRTQEQYPHPLPNGPFPGMLEGGDGLTPRPDVRPEVDLLHARIQVDLLGGIGKKRLWRLALAVPLGLFLALLLRGITPTSALVAGCISLAYILYLCAVRIPMRRKLAKYQRMLQAAGIAWPPTDS
ncbi:hypothetical protein [Streptomyces sp. NBC_01766]|uniref:hypothetical protein n=1 Tax=Streptomyces sp. NBC_01766 TaxID=2975936 RepID=UPI002DDAC59F|nr:hypothetical protein [Streptomyces sp. NBC_01766]WSC20131.1 hypothetical protein OIE60_10800 [Streptomyces sp. NBC_01766]